MRIERKNKAEYFNNEKLSKMKIDKTITTMMLDVRQINLVLLVTDASTNDANDQLESYKITFNRIKN